MKIYQILLLIGVILASIATSFYLVRMISLLLRSKDSKKITDKELDEKCRRHVHIEVDNVEKASCILDERYPESQIKVYLRNVIK